MVVLGVLWYVGKYFIFIYTVEFLKVLHTIPLKLNEIEVFVITIAITLSLDSRNQKLSKSPKNVTPCGISSSFIPLNPLKATTYHALKAKRKSSVRYHYSYHTRTRHKQLKTLQVSKKMLHPVISKKNYY